jgi:hypothetical protein
MSIFQLTAKINHVCEDSTLLLNIGGDHPTLSIHKKELPAGTVFAKNDVIEFSADVKTRKVKNTTTGEVHASKYLHGTQFKLVSVSASTEEVIEEDFVMSPAVQSKAQPVASPVTEDDAPF